MLHTARSTGSMWARWTLLAATLLVGAIPSAQAFESLPPGSSPHDHVTAEAATPLGWNGDGLKALQEAVLAPDFSESTAKIDQDKVIVIDATAAYESSHHCDRLPPTADAAVFASTSAYIRLQRDQALQLIQAGHDARAVAAVGRALHSLQDCHSHSDVSEKTREEVNAFQAALLNGDELSPSDVRFTSFQPGHEEPELPLGDPYPHGTYAKDGPDSNDDARFVLPDGRTKYEAAFDMAVETSAMFLGDFLVRLTPSEKASLLAVVPEEDGGPALIPPLGTATVIFALIAVGFARKRMK